MSYLVQFSFMNLGFWNIRGLGHPIAKAGVCSLVKLRKLKLFAIIDTNIREEESSAVVKSMFPSWSFYTNYSFAESVRVWVLWDPKTVQFVPICMTE